jgi:hypothetical protein
MNDVKRATAAEFETWKVACIANPAKLDGLPNNVKDYWRKEFEIDLPVKVARAVTMNSDNGSRLRLQLHGDATLAEIAEFTQRIIPLMPAIPIDQFHLLLRKAQAAMARIDATWEDVFNYSREEAA